MLVQNQLDVWTHHKGFTMTHKHDNHDAREYSPVGTLVSDDDSTLFVLTS